MSSKIVYKILLLFQEATVQQGLELKFRLNLAIAKAGYSLWPCINLRLIMDKLYYWTVIWRHCFNSSGHHGGCYLGPKLHPGGGFFGP